MAIAPVIHIVDDDDSMRDALGRLLGALDFDVRQYASAGDFLLSWPPMDAPGCLLLDIRMPGPSGLDLQRSLSRREDAPPIIFLSAFGDIPTSVQAIRQGAVDFLTKPVEKETLINAITSALECDVQRRQHRQHLQQGRDRLASLTPREHAVFDQVIAGRLNKQIADSLRMCERTVKAHRARVMEKMGVRTVAELVQLAVHLEAEEHPQDAPRRLHAEVALAS
ncbi:response regulator transcription factor [Lysobacter sp. HA35]